MSQEFKPFNQETDPNYNREGGIVIVPGSNFAKEMAKWEEFPSKWTVGSQPGNPYTYRPYPKMLFRAEHYNGKPLCMAVPPNPTEYVSADEYRRAEAAAQQFTVRCQRIVKDETEESRAKEDGWRNSPQEAVDYLWNRDRAKGVAAAERAYSDSKLSEVAQREVAAVLAASEDKHLPEIPETPVKRGPGRPRKNPV